MLVLASNSPRRKQLLALTGWQFSIIPASVDERVMPGDDVESYVLRTSERKARASCVLISPGERAGTTIIACDTAVVDGGEILGKPADVVEAEGMLRRLRGRVHQVYSALTILGADNETLLQDVCVTDVPMRQYRDDEMKAYIASGDPLDKAGAYAIQHPGFSPVTDMVGCYANVMGLPLCHLVRVLAKSGFTLGRGVALACQEALEYRCPVYGKVLDWQL